MKDCIAVLCTNKHCCIVYIISLFCISIFLSVNCKYCYTDENKFTMKIICNSSEVDGRTRLI